MMWKDLPTPCYVADEKKLKEMEENAIKQTVAFIPENGENSENGQHTANTQNFPNSASNGTNSVHNQNNSQNEVPEYNDPDYIPPQDGDYIPMEEMGAMPEDIELDNAVIEEQKYIMGKPSKAKEKLIKIKDITANDGRVALEGRVLTVECRETKSGKGMLIIDLYDGTGTMTCFVFFWKVWNIVFYFNYCVCNYCYISCICVKSCFSYNFYSFCLFYLCFYFISFFDIFSK